MQVLKRLLNSLLPPETKRVPAELLRQIASSFSGRDMVARIQSLDQTGQGSAEQVFKQLVEDGYMTSSDVCLLRELYTYHETPAAQRSALGPPFFMPPAARKRADKLTWLRCGLGAECPKCLQMTARHEGHGGWRCLKGCDLSEYRQCPRCGDLFQGTAPFCRQDCKDFRAES
jgi:hypothetical protein